MWWGGRVNFAELLKGVEVGDRVFWATAGTPRQDSPSTVVGVERADDTWQIEIEGPHNGKYWLINQDDQVKIYYRHPPADGGTSKGQLTEFGILVKRTPVEQINPNGDLRHQ